MTERIVYIAYSNLWLMGSLYGINERTGLEGLEPCMSHGQRPMSTLVAGQLIGIVRTR